MKCFYHDDADGKCAGFWVAAAADYTDKYAPEYIEMNYSKPFPMDSIKPGEQIYIVDYSISLEDMTKLLEITKDVTWIDHHKTAIEKYQDFPEEIRGVRYDGIAGCMLTYCYLLHMTDNGKGEIKPFDISMTESAPRFTKLIADWDVWKFDYGDDTRHFITAFNAYSFHPESKEWDKFFCFPDGMINSATSDLILNGMTMTAFRDGWAKGYMKLGFETEFEGVKCFAVNLGHCNSEYFKSLPEGKYDVLMPFVFNGEKFTVSMYSKTVDVSEIAKKYGGGGHKGASGFQCYDLPFHKIG